MSKKTKQQPESEEQPTLIDLPDGTFVISPAAIEKSIARLEAKIAMMRRLLEESRELLARLGLDEEGKPIIT